MSHTIGSGNARISLTNGRERNKKVQESGHAVRDIFCRDIKPIRTLHSTEEPEGLNHSPRSIFMNVPERRTLASLRFSSGSLLQASDDSKRGDH